MLADGASIKAIAERLGHSDPALTLRVYAHLLPGIQRQAVEALHKRWEKPRQSVGEDGHPQL